MAETTAKAQKKKNPYLWKKGQSGNPAGRPQKGQSFAEILDAELLKQTKEVELNGETRVVNGKQLLALALLSIALGKKTKDHDKLVAIERIMDRVDGSIIQSLNLEGELSSSLKLTFLDDVPDVKEDSQPE